MKKQLEFKKTIIEREKEQLDKDLQEVIINDNSHPENQRENEFYMDLISNEIIEKDLTLLEINDKLELL